tara:strand:+ start:685 stop:1239 length:555 start_codon:yes stop_codon:yes gene_type:complete
LIDRYKFEDSISSYLDNEMNLKERQEFEDYMDENPEAKSLLEDVRNNIHLIKEMSQVNTSPNFINKLFSRIEYEKNRPLKKVIEKPSNTFFGFSPLYASLMSVLVVSFVSIGLTMWSDNIPSTISLPELKGSIVDSSPGSPSNINLMNNKDLVATNVDSSIDSTINKSKNLNLDGKVKFVKNKR